mgnify:CR=1 FL=1|tara:strand:+ start:1281 stop:2045 length:765 start_codon:yes stop_codon:yes gene_type:complete
MQKTNFNQLSKIFRSLLSKSSKDFLVIHSDLTKIGLYYPKNKNILEDIAEIFPKKTICIPAFTTNSFTSKKIYKPEFDRSEVGSLGEIARKSGWQRTNNPMHSYFINKPFDKITHTEYKAEIKTSSFGNSSFLADIEKNAQVLQIGCFQNSYVHRAENIFKVDYRFSKKFNGSWNYKSEKGLIENETIVRYLNIKGIEELDRNKSRYQFWDSEFCQSMFLNKCLLRTFTAQNFLNFTLDKLDKNKYYLTAIDNN